MPTESNDNSWIPQWYRANGQWCYYPCDMGGGSCGGCGQPMCDHVKVDPPPTPACVKSEYEKLKKQKDEIVAREEIRIMTKDNGISADIREFAAVMTSRMRSFDEKLGTNNYITSMTIDDALDNLQAVTRELWDMDVKKDWVKAKALAVDAANLTMIIWSKLP